MIACNLVGRSPSIIKNNILWELSRTLQTGIKQTDISSSLSLQNEESNDLKSLSSLPGPQERHLKKKIKNRFDIKRQFVDWVTTKVKGGNGGSGCTHRRKVGPNSGPDGGDGGRGGSVVVVASENCSQLKHVLPHYYAKNGEKGAVNNRTGRSALNMFIQVPCGTTVTDVETSEVLADLIYEGDRELVARGGSGGIGNAIFKVQIDKDSEPIEATSGEKGEERTIALEMKTIADVGLVGFPNAGKSTLLRALSNATPKVAAYPFTTLRPHIGRIEYKDQSQIAVADIPGLIEGAHENKGLGHSFLRHVERCSSLVFVVDLSEEMPDQAIEILSRELDLYKSGLSKLPSLVVANKIDIVRNTELHLKNLTDAVSLPIIGISGKHRINIEELKILLRNMCEK